MKLFDKLALEAAERVLAKELGEPVAMPPSRSIRGDYTGFPYAEVYGEIKLGDGVIATILAEQYQLEHGSLTQRVRILRRRYNWRKLPHHLKLHDLQSRVDWPAMRLQRSSVKDEDPDACVDTDMTEDEKVLVEGRK